MSDKKNILYENIKKYRFELRHVTVLFAILMIFQIIISFVQKSSLESFLDDTENWYQQDDAERLANVTTISLELLLENIGSEIQRNPDKQHKLIESINIIFSQQLLQQNVEKICLIIERGDQLFAVDDGEELLRVMNYLNGEVNVNSNTYKDALKFYRENLSKVKSNEEVFSMKSENNKFHTLVPFVPNGEFLGALYMENIPDFSLVTNEIISNYDETAVIYSSLILLGLLAMYYISSYTVKERDEAQQLFLEEHEQHIKEQVVHEKESLFTKRIYHTHHKAEKVMGFIKEDLRSLTPDNIEEIKFRLNKYSNFVSRVIYDMKWYDPPISTIRGQMFNTDLNQVIKFIVDNLFLRISAKSGKFDFELDLDERLPKLHINEFVIWEILEPLIQNSIDHGRDEKLTVKINTKYFEDENLTEVRIEDNGNGIAPELLETDDKGIKKIFLENITTRNTSQPNRGYGCYIAYQMATLRCGWELDAMNTNTGAMFIIKIKN